MTTRATPPDYQIIAKGYTSKVFRIGNTNKVVKVLLDDTERGYVAQEYFDAECSVYERLWGDSAVHSPPSSILAFFGPDPFFSTGLILELAENDNLGEYVWKYQPVSRELVMKWARQAAEGFAYIHKRGVLHRDIHVINLFLDAKLNLKIGDFGASSIDGGKGLMLYRETYQLWVSDAHIGSNPQKRIEISVRSEVFALGSALFHLATGQDPMEELLQVNDDVEIKRRMQKREMPVTDELGVLGELINGCWNLTFQNMEEVLKAIDNRSLIL